MKAMTRTVGQYIMGYFFGAALCTALLHLVKVAGSEANNYLVMGYGLMFSIAVGYGKFTSQLRERDITDFEKKLETKASKVDLEYLKCEVEDLKKAQDEIHRMVTDIYKLLIKS